MGTVALLVAVGPGDRHRPGRYAALGLGVCVDLAFWESSLALFLVVPALLWALASARGSVHRLVLPGLAGVIVGAAPALIYKLGRGVLLPWRQGQSASPESAPGQLTGLANPVIEMFLGVARPFSGARAASWLPPLAIGIIALALLAWAILARWRGLVGVITLRTGRRAPIDAVLAGFVLFVVAYGFSAYTVYTRQPRYLFSPYPLLALAVALGIWRIPGRLHGIVGAVVVACVLVLTMTTMRTADATGETTAHVGGLPVKTQDMPAVVAALHRLGVRDLYANYWLAYPIAFAADGTVSVAPTGGLDRFRSQSRAVNLSTNPAYAAPVGGPADRLQAALAASGAHTERIDITSIAIFWHITPPRRPDQLARAGL